MITHWEIYWVLQLDAIKVALALAATVAMIYFIITLIGGASRYLGSFDEARNNVIAWQAVKRRAFKTSLPIAIACFVCLFTLPSTKTAAAMIVVPQIVNSPTIQHEAGDLYKLAKEALRDAIAPKPSK